MILKKIFNINILTFYQYLMFSKKQIIKNYIGTAFEIL